MEKYKVIDCRLYRVYITIYIGSKEGLLKLLHDSTFDSKESKEALIKMISESTMSYGGATYGNKYDSNIIIHFPELKKDATSIANVAHEMLHCVFDILSSVGVCFHEGEGNEEFAYLLSFLMEQFYSKDDWNTIKENISNPKKKCKKDAKKLVKKG